MANHFSLELTLMGGGPNCKSRLICAQAFHINEIDFSDIKEYIYTFLSYPFSVPSVMGSPIDWIVFLKPLTRYK